MSASGGARLYHELAAWWPLLSPPEDYVEETEDLVAEIGPTVQRYVDGRV